MTTKLDHHLRRIWRASLTPGSLLDLEELLEALPGRSPGARSWVEAHVQPVGAVSGVDVYRWGDAVDALRSTDPPMSVDTTRWLSTAQAAEQVGVARCTLDAMVSRAPPDLPGAPVLVGAGRRRKRWRWDPTKLEAWLAAFTEWDQRSPARPPPKRRRASGSDRPGGDDAPVDWRAAARGR